MGYGATASQNRGFPFDFECRSHNSVTHYRATLWFCFFVMYARSGWSWSLQLNSRYVTLVAKSYSYRIEPTSDEQIFYVMF